MSTTPLDQNHQESTTVGTEANSSTTLRDMTTELASLTTTSDNPPTNEIESMSHPPLSMAPSNHSEEKRIKKRKLSFETTMLRQKKQRVDDSATVIPSTIGIVMASTEVHTAEIPLVAPFVANEDVMSEAEEAEEKRIKRKNSHEASVNLGLGKRFYSLFLMGVSHNELNIAMEDDLNNRTFIISME